MRICPRCGKQTGENAAHFCSHCAAPLAPPKQTYALPPEQPPMSPADADLKQKLPLLLALGCFALSVVLGLPGLFNLVLSLLTPHLQPSFGLLCVRVAIFFVAPLVAGLVLLALYQKKKKQGRP